MTTTQTRAGAGVIARLRAWPALGVLVGWTVFLWVSRLRNVLGNDELDDLGIAWRVAVVVVFVLLTAAAAGGRAIAVLVWWTIGYWLVRGGGILLDDHDAAFTAIHTALMAVSIGAAMWVWRTRTR
ncbi:MAG: hypothetical protein AAGA90_08400 [Actinomycetota bacterium]